MGCLRKKEAAEKDRGPDPEKENGGVTSQKRVTMIRGQEGTQNWFPLPTLSPFLQAIPKLLLQEALLVLEILYQFGLFQRAPFSVLLESLSPCDRMRSVRHMDSRHP